MLNKKKIDQNYVLKYKLDMRQYYDVSLFSNLINNDELSLAMEDENKMEKSESESSEKKSCEHCMLKNGTCASERECNSMKN